MESSSDIHLWKRIKLGDTSAFQALYEKYIDDLILFGQKLCSDNGLVEDTLQQLFLRLWEGRSTAPIPTHTKAYLMKSLRNNLLRAVKQEQVISDIDIEHHLRDIPGLSCASSDSGAIQMLQSAIVQLPTREREILHLRYYQEIRNQEIAEIMGISYQSVCNLLQRAIRKMRLLVPRNSL